MKAKSGRLWVAVALIVVFVVFAAGLVATFKFSAGDRICRGVTISGIKVGGLTRQEAGQMMSSWAANRMDRRVTLTALDTRWIGAVSDFGGRVDWKTAVDRAYAVGREGNIISRMACVLTRTGVGKKIDALTVVDHSKLEKTVAKVARAVSRPHQDARLVSADGRLEVRQDSVGIKLDEKQAVNIVTGALQSGKLVVPLEVEPDKPDVTSEDAAKITTLLARFTTPFNPARADRTHNLALAAKAISGVILKPGNRFSYNDEVGPRLAGRGFRNAPIFVRGKLEPGLGGGICQVSSTLYNAVLLAGIRVVERHPHSRTVPYADPGRDATVAYGLQDFQFENSGASPICILTHLGRNHLTVDIFGAPEDKKSITIFTGPVKRLSERPQKTVFDATLPAGARKVVDKGAVGVRVVVYKKVFSPDGTVKTEVVSRDRYPAQSKIIAVGPARESGDSIRVKPASLSGNRRNNEKVRAD
ncbi:VanW family protein [bacterium]|nr:VanW family protein [bacterium]